MLRVVVLALFLLASAHGCAGEAGKPEDAFLARRLAMVKFQIAARGVKDKRVLEAMEKVPRHEFVPKQHVELAYNDYPLPIGLDQTISQPYIVALMTEAVELKPKDRVLEIGTGSGYQAAVLAEIAGEVYTIEILPELAERAEKTLKRLRYKNVRVKAGDGFLGWPEAAPFDAIIVTAAPPEIPPPLLKQLAEGGRLVIPVGENYQELILARKKKGKIIRKPIIPVRFVPMTGENVEKMKKRRE